MGSVVDHTPITLAELAGSPVWVGWRQEKRNGRSTKVPYDAVSGARAKSDSPDTWAPRDQAEFWAAKERGNGVGIVLTEIRVGTLLLAGIDLDTCRDSDSGDIEPWAQEVVDRFKTYGEVSPSGTGLKLFFCILTADKSSVDSIFSGQTGRQFKRSGDDHPPAIEVYRGGRYFTVTDESIGPDDNLRVVTPDDLRWLIQEVGPKFAGEGKKTNGADSSRSARAFCAGADLKATGATYAEMRKALIESKDSEIADWARTKGLANGERELRRIFDKVEGPSNIINPRAPYDVARLFQNSLATPLRYHRGAFFEWNGAAWPEAGEAMLRARLYAFLDQCKSGSVASGLHRVKPDQKMVSAVLDALRSAACLDDAISPPTWIHDAGPPAEEIIACANGLLHLPDLRLLPHSPSFFNPNVLNFAFDPMAGEPSLWLKFLQEAWPNDSHSIGTLQEIFGYLLTTDTRQQKAFMFIGPKRSGKGTVCRVLKRLVGDHNCVSPTLAGLGTNFGLAPLIGKQVALMSDARLSGRADQQAVVERLLSVTGEDGITIDRKYASAWTGQLTVRFVIAANELPRLSDASGAVASRFVLLMMKESFYGREDLGLTAKLLEELPGILNWAIAGWFRLTERGYFQQPDSAKEALEQLEDLGSPIGAFVRDRCELGAEHRVEVDVLFGSWLSWCDDEGRDHPGTKESFGRDVRAAAPRVRKVRPREGASRSYYYEGIRIRPNP